MNDYQMNLTTYGMMKPFTLVNEMFQRLAFDFVTFHLTVILKQFLNFSFNI